MADKPKDELDLTLAYLRRSRAELDQHITDIEKRRKDTAEILSDMRKWRERVAKTADPADDDPTVRLRR